MTASTHLDDSQWDNIQKLGYKTASDLYLDMQNPNSWWRKQFDNLIILEAIRVEALDHFMWDLAFMASQAEKRELNELEFKQLLKERIDQEYREFMQEHLAEYDIIQQTPGALQIADPKLIENLQTLQNIESQLTELTQKEDKIYQDWKEDCYKQAVQAVQAFAERLQEAGVQLRTPKGKIIDLSNPEHHKALIEAYAEVPAILKNLFKYNENLAKEFAQITDPEEKKDFINRQVTKLNSMVVPVNAAANTIGIDAGISSSAEEKKTYVENNRESVPGQLKEIYDNKDFKTNEKQKQIASLNETLTKSGIKPEDANYLAQRVIEICQKKVYCGKDPEKRISEKYEYLLKEAEKDPKLQLVLERKDIFTRELIGELFKGTASPIDPGQPKISANALHEVISNMQKLKEQKNLIQKEIEKAPEWQAEHAIKAGMSSQT